MARGLLLGGATFGETTMKIFAFAFLVAGITACATTDNIQACINVCDRYKQCYDSSYDTTDCYDQCRDKSNDNASHAQEVDDCSNCIDGKSCTGATFDCGTECAPIIPNTGS